LEKLNSIEKAAEKLNVSSENNCNTILSTDETCELL